MAEFELTPAGRQVERALAGGWTVAAHNLYWFNIREDVAMVVGDQTPEVSVWPEWHRMIQARIGEPVMIGEELAKQEADELGLEGRDRDDYISERIDELNYHNEPSIVEVTDRDEHGQVIGTHLEPNA